ncbi:MAG: D-glycerate dehydrogenase [Negativicutes bacterium]|jgi:glyoxylate reductase
MKKVYITRSMPEIAEQLLKAAGFTVKTFEQDRVIDKQILLREVTDADAVISMLSDKIDSDVINAATRCKIFANYAVGYNNIDVTVARERGIYVTNTPGVLTDATADLTWALLLDCARRVTEGDKLTRLGEFTGWAPLFMRGVQVTGKTLGLIGAGRIALAVAERARGFDMKIIYYARSNKTNFEQVTGATRVDLITLLKQSDFISLHIPLTPDTHYLINEHEIRMMKPTAVLINTARGPVVNEAALITALKNNRIFAAGLDVYEHEPELTQGLAELDNVVLAPHVGSATFETRDAMAKLVVENVVAALNGEVPQNLVW